MNEKTAKALEASIKHWGENLKLAKTGQLTYDDISGETCALCHLFVVPSGIDYDGRCGGCPVKTRTGYGSCQGSPWPGILTASSVDNLVIAVEAEIDFLKSLREEPCS